MNNINVLVAPNSFKECADAVELVAIFKSAFETYTPSELKNQINFLYKPISDGGDGFLEVCKYYYGLELFHFDIPYPFGKEKFSCPVGYSIDKKLLFIESAEVLGLKRIPKDFRNPLELSSRGMGELLIQIINSIDSGLFDVKHVIIGIGGTGINDLGLGMMEAFGLEIYDEHDNKLEVLPKNFTNVKKIIVPQVELPFDIEVILDVENPLLGKKGACRAFAQQKGASKEDVIKLEKGFQNILKELELNEDFINKLSGAGGGLAAGFKIFFNSNEKYGEEFIKKDLEINSKNLNCNLVITGEGKFDFQSAMNKAVMVILNDFVDKNIPIYLVCGEVEGELPDNENIHLIELAEYFESSEESIENIVEGIDIAAKKIIEFIKKMISNKELEN
ncbi:MAG: glycerate kinase [Melioribacter sp.]|nr:glycerate kinase [Melioribacter sp.]